MVFMSRKISYNLIDEFFLSGFFFGDGIWWWR